MSNEDILSCILFIVLCNKGQWKKDLVLYSVSWKKTGFMRDKGIIGHKSRSVRSAPKANHALVEHNYRWLYI